MFLESPQNPRVKMWTALKTKKGRTEEGLFVVEGSRLVHELLESALHVHAVLWDVGTDELPDEFLQRVRSRGIPFYELSPKAFAAVSDTVTPQGVLAVAAIPGQQADASAVQAECVLLLDGVQDPGNAGTLIRTAEAFGVDALCCGTGTVDPFAPKVVRASMGGLFRLPVLSVNSSEYIQKWKECHPTGHVVLTTAAARTACDEADFRGPTLMLIGNEAVGVSAEAAGLATMDVCIPMSGRAESLNAAIAGSVLLYEVARQRRTGS